MSDVMRRLSAAALLPFFCAYLAAPTCQAATCDSQLTPSDWEAAAGSNLTNSGLGALHNTVLGEVLSGDTSAFTAPLSNGEVALTLDLTHVGWTTHNNGYSLATLAADLSLSASAAEEFAATVAANMKAMHRQVFLEAGAYELVDGELQLRYLLSEALPAVVDHLANGGCISSAMQAELQSFMSESWEYPADFTASLNSHFGGESWVGADRLVADAAIEVGTASLAYWTDPTSPGGQNPTPHGSWGEAAAADTVGTAVGVLFGGLVGALVGTAMAPGVGTAAGVTAGMVAGAKIGAVIGGVVGGAATSVQVKRKQDAAPGCSCDCPCV